MTPIIPNSPQPKQNPERILISRLSAHGDVIQTLPVLAALKALNPQLFIGWLVETDAAALLEGHPLIDYLHISHRKRWLKSLRSLNVRQWLQTLTEWNTFLQTLRASQYDVSLDIQGLMKSALLPWLANIPRRIGFKATREWAWLTYTETIAPHDLKNPHRSTISVFLDFLSPVGFDKTDLASLQILFPLRPIDSHVETTVAAWVSDFTNSTSIEKQKGPLLVLAPETAWESKHWPLNYWRDLIEWLNQQNCRWILIGTGQTLDITDLNPSSLGSGLDLRGKTTWPQLQALLKHADYFIGMDSGPLHLASAVASHSNDSHQVLKPLIIGLYGPTAPGRTGPYQPGQHAGKQQHQTLSLSLPCQPCFERKCPLGTEACLDQLSPRQVIETLRSLLAKWN
ncbi:MAG: glycosyltransferase family 9 protein [Cyanobacteria bacterium]|nr:glycosyltransferase family 9 protein [Cyanobacteriota bacterium]